MKSSSQPTLPFDSISSVIDDVRMGKIVILTDDEDRENEGDLIIAAEKVTPSAINFMARFGRGLICAPITPERAEQLGLPPMVQHNREIHQTHFTVSVDAAHHITTGISAHDRARTIKLLSKPNATPSDLVQPGHVFPLQAKKGGVLRRAGHTEAAVDLSRLAGLDPSAVICEILNEDGTMARLPELLEMSRQYDIKIATIKHLIEYRHRTENLVVKEESRKIRTDYGDFHIHRFRSILDGTEHLALAKGKISKNTPTLVRVQSQSIADDVFATRKQGTHNIDLAMKKIATAKSGIILYMRHLRPSISLSHASSDEPHMDLREYGIGAQILHSLGVRKMKLLTNHPRKVVGVEGYGLELVEQVSLKPTRPKTSPTKKKNAKRTAKKLN